MLNLHLAGVQEVGVCPQLSGTRLRGVPGPGGLVEEHHKHRLIPQGGVWDSAGKFQLQVICRVQAGVNLLPAPLLQGDQVLAGK